jgi:hypothetical protein
MRSGEVLRPAEILAIEWTLRVPHNVSEYKSFSFDMFITGAET